MAHAPILQPRWHARPRPGDRGSTVAPPGAPPGANAGAPPTVPRPRLGWRSIVCKNLGLFLLILLSAVGPLALRYEADSRTYALERLAAQLEFFAERGASWLDAATIMTLTQPAHRQTPAYQQVLDTLRRIEREFDVDNAVLMRREADGQYTFIAAGHDSFAIGQPVYIHTWFPATYAATNETWLRGAMLHSQLFGGRVGDQVFDQFLADQRPPEGPGAGGGDLDVE